MCKGVYKAMSQVNGLPECEDCNCDMIEISHKQWYQDDHQELDYDVLIGFKCPKCGLFINEYGEIIE